MPTELPPPRPPQPPPEPAGDPIFRGVQGAILMVSLLALLALFLLPFLSPKTGRGEPWRVAVTPPQFLTDGGGDDYRRAMLEEAFLETADRMLAARNGLFAERLERLDGGGDGPTTAAEVDEELRQRAFTAGFDELLTLAVQCDGEECRALLRRLRSVDGSAEWRRPFRFDAASPLEAAEELADELHVAFLKFSRRTDGARLLADAEVYDAYLRAILDHRRGLLPTGKAIRSIGELRAEAPRFLDLHLLEAELRAGDGDAEGAVDLLAVAHRIAPGDIRPLLRQVPLLLELRRREEAREVLRTLEELLPGEPRLLTWREHIAK
ncbi:MAG: hypothetical protein AAGF23_08365 [Acidobacteriota bacterium]